MSEEVQANQQEEKKNEDAALHAGIAGDLRTVLGEHAVFDRSGEILPSVEVHPDALVEAVRHLKESARYDAAFLDCITATDLMDYPGPETNRDSVPWASLYPAPAAGGEGEAAAKRRLFLLVYHLYSLTTNRYYFLKVVLPAERLEIATIDHLYGDANWHEREAFDLLGIRFVGSRDLRRILLPEDWVGYPLRRDYRQGGSYHGMSTSRPDPLAAMREKGLRFKEILSAEEEAKQ